jgi:hypothetical protein
MRSGRLSAGDDEAGAGNSQTAPRLLCGPVVVATHARRKARVYVSIVSANPETLDGLHSYLCGAGVSSHCTRGVQDLALVAPELATAAVIFPDDFENEEVLVLLRALRRARPRLLSLIVTRAPQCFRDVVQDDGRSLPPVVLPKPSFGWDILDAIRAHSEAAHV